MSVLVLSPKIAEFRPFWEQSESRFDLPGFDLHGLAGRQLHERMAQVVEQWRETTQELAPSVIEDAPAYRHVPFEKVKTIRVRYRPAKPLPPRRFSDDGK